MTPHGNGNTGYARNSLHYPEIDVATFTVGMPDGRAGHVEDWFDVETRLFLRTVWYPARGLQHWTPGQHVHFLRMAGLAKGYRDDSGSFEVFVGDDAAGESTIIVNLVASD